jgi:hypothetical protein
MALIYCTFIVIDKKIGKISGLSKNILLYIALQYRWTGHFINNPFNH